MIRHLAVSAVVVLALLAGQAGGQDIIRFNTYDDYGPLEVITDHAVVGDPGVYYTGISWAGTGHVVVDFTAPRDIVVDKLFFQCGDMHTPGAFDIDLKVNGVNERYVYVNGIDASGTLTDVEWDFEVDLALTAGDAVTLDVDHEVSMPESSTAARLTIWLSGHEGGAVATDVFGGQNPSPLALLEYDPTGPLLPGDANTDGIVDLQDFGVLKDHFGTTTGGTWETADFNDDGAIDLQDFGILKDHFGFTSGDVLATAVPEPASTLLPAAGLALAGARRRRSTGGPQ